MRFVSEESAHDVAAGAALNERAVALVGEEVDLADFVPVVDDARYLNRVEIEGEVPPAVVTETATPVAVSAAGVVTVMLVAELATIVPAFAPNFTEVGFERFVPVMVTVVPPEVLPDVGEKDVIFGGAVYVNPFERDVEPEAAVR